MKRKRLTSVRAVVIHLGGVEAVARLTGRSKSNVRNWVALRRMSAPTFLTISAALYARDAIAPPRLWGIEECRNIKLAA
ncbi:hypothetical protein EHM76_00210 [bacterium]|nr:MAG: hypothetical protein EHM76_00210 [bacterium]